MALFFYFIKGVHGRLSGSASVADHWNDRHLEFSVWLLKMCCDFLVMKI
jgi:hypothetical protein